MLRSKLQDWALREPVMRITGFHSAATVSVGQDEDKESLDSSVSAFSCSSSADKSGIFLLFIIKKFK